MRVGPGREAFAAFYRAYRAHVRRWKDGIEFPVLVDGAIVRQGVAAAVARLEAGDGWMADSVPGEPVKGWSEVAASGGDPGAVEDLVRVLGFLEILGAEARGAHRRAQPGRAAAAAGGRAGDRVVMDVTDRPSVSRAIPGPPTSAAAWP